MVFAVVFQASTGKKLREKKHRKSYGTRKFDAKHSTNIYVFDFPAQTFLNLKIMYVGTLYNLNFCMILNFLGFLFSVGR